MDINTLKREIKVGEMLGCYSHAVLYKDRRNEEFKIYFVDKGRDINITISSLLNLGYRVKEVYNYNEDIEKQLKENEKKHKNVKEERALKFANRMHEGQIRKDKTPYIEHPKRVAKYVKYFKKDSKHLDILIPAALLHDTLEDTNLSFYDIVEFFGAEIAGVVLELTTDDELKKEIGKSRYLELKMKNMSSWALTIKLCDRLDNVSDLVNANEEFRNRYVKETLEIINFLLENRNLSKTQYRIILTIVKRINKIENMITKEEYEKIRTFVRKKNVW